ncbi:MAG: pseudouridine synthase [Cyanobacteria bacterium J06560_6]
MTERLQKLLSKHGIASRRQAERLISGGRVTVNGEVARIGQQADDSVDCIRVDGVALGVAPQCVYLLLHKPKGVVSTCHDPQGRRTVLALLERSLQRGSGLHPVGRLDADSTGALLLTNDGDLTYRLTHPRHNMPKVYQVSVQGMPSKRTLRQWREGVCLDDRLTLPAGVRLLRALSDTQALLEITLTEGRNRQIRRVAKLLGHPVTALHRIKIGSLPLGSLRRGHYRLLTSEEVIQLKHSAADLST